MLMGSPFRKKETPDISLRLCTKAVGVVSGSWSPRVDPADPAQGFARGYP